MKWNFAKSIVVAALAWTATAGQAKELATVNGEKISEEEFKDAAAALGPRAQMMLANPQMRKQFLDHIIDSRLLANAAEKKKVDQS